MVCRGMEDEIMSIDGIRESFSIPGYYLARDLTNTTMEDHQLSFPTSNNPIYSLWPSQSRTRV